MSTPPSPTGLFSGPVVLTGVVPGYAVIPLPTPLTFLNYYDGKFLQTSDLRQEQLATLSMIQLSNQAAGTPGPSYGFDVTLGSGDKLTLGPGLGIDPQGRVLYLPQSVDVAVSDLLASMQPQAGSGTVSPPASTASAGFQPCDVAVPGPSTTPVSGTDLYLITLSAAEGLCGTDEVFGRVCDAACVTASDRPWRIEGVLLGLVPLTLGPLATSTSVLLTQTHLRSRVASAYYAAEAAAGGSLISAAGLAASSWCLGATAVAGNAIYLGVLARSGGSTVFLDEWTARRERIEESPRRYWAGRMGMRPWNTFLAQVLQFQCQLADVAGSGGGVGGSATALSQALTLLQRSATLIDELNPATAPAAPGAPAAPPPASTLAQDVAEYRHEVSDVLAGRAIASTHMLIDGGIVELPPAGYLPVDPTAATALETQVSQLLGLGVDLRFCVMRHDKAGAEFTGGQHLDRISLLTGLDDPTQRQQVDIFVPDGTWQTASVTAPAAEPSIKPTLDWVLFRRRSDVDCGPPPQQLDTVTLYAVPANSEGQAKEDWGVLTVGRGQTLQWTKVGELQFDAGAASLVTTGATVQGWWSAAGVWTNLFGAAYAPAATTSDPLALGRVGNLVTALSPLVSNPVVPSRALTASPKPLEPGTAGALFAVTWPTLVTVAVWSAEVIDLPTADLLWAQITGTGTGKVAVDWVSAGTAVLAVGSPPKVMSWPGAPPPDTRVLHAGYSPGSMLTGAAGVQALVDQIVGGDALRSPIAVVTKPPKARVAGTGGSVFMIVPNPLQ